MTVAVLLATDEAGDRPSAALRFRDGTVLGHLRDQLAALGVRRQYVLARPRHAERLARTCGVEVCESPAPADDLHWVARLARGAHDAGEPIIVLPANLACHREALAGLLADHRIAVGALVTTVPTSGTTPVRVEHDRVVSAGSTYHRVSDPNAWFVGVLRIDAGRAGTLAGIAGRLAPLAAKECLHDVTALLLVGVVRAGTHVDTRDARALHCQQVADKAAADAADAAMRAVDEDRVLLESVVKADDGFFTTFFVSPYSKHVARWAARRGLSPNAVTTISLVIGAGAAACFALGTRAWLVAGAVLLQVAFAADCVDGQLARYTRTFSALGGWLDGVFDRVKEYAAYAGLATGAAVSGVGSVWALAVAALGLQTARHMVDFDYAAAHPRVVAALPRRPLDEPGDGGDAQVHPVARSQRRQPYGLGVAATKLSRRLEERPGTRWLKKIIVLPIGERFALISVTAAVGGARVTFAALLMWGGVAATYTVAGRLLRSLAREPGPRASPSARRDDGPLVWLASSAGLVGLLPPSWRRRYPGRLDWLMTPMLRTAEYALIGVLGVVSGAPAATFALVGVVAFHHYDMVYRARQRVAVPGWLCRAGLGWEGRMLVAAVAAAAGAVLPVYTALAGALGLVFVGESVATWRNGRR